MHGETVKKKKEKPVPFMHKGVLGNRKNTIKFYSVIFASFIILVYRCPGLTKSGTSLTKRNETASTANGERERERERERARAMKAEALYGCFRSLTSPIYLYDD